MLNVISDCYVALVTPVLWYAKCYLRLLCSPSNTCPLTWWMPCLTSTILSLPSRFSCQDFPFPVDSSSYQVIFLRWGKNRLAKLCLLLSLWALGEFVWELHNIVVTSWSFYVKELELNQDLEFVSIKFSHFFVWLNINDNTVRPNIHLCH